jgi:hypothetical protein
MSRKQNGPRYIFRGEATPFGARIEAVNEKPNYELIKGPPAAALSAVGGWSIATSSGSCCHDSFKWGATVADCKGEWKGGQLYVSTGMASIADVYIKNNPHVFEASQLRIRVVSEDDDLYGQPRIAPRETVFEGMRLDEQSITVTYDVDDLTKFPTFDEFEREYQTNRSFFDKYQPALRRFPDAGEFGAPLPRTPGGYTPIPFVRKVKWKEEIQGNVLSLKGFGNIHFGEVLMGEYSRRVTMVRLELGCALRGSASLAGTDPGGTWTP